MIAELVSIGMRLLNGSQRYTNVCFLAEQCAGLGLDSYYQTVVDEEPKRTEAVIRAALDRSDIVIVNGGLGAEQNDAAKLACEAVMECKIEDALVLSGGEGVMPGYVVEKDEKVMILLPGDPETLIPMFTQQVYPYLQAKQAEVCYTRVVKICGMEEAEVKEHIADLQKEHTNLEFYIYTKPGEVHIRISGKAGTEELVKEQVKPVVKEIKKRLGDVVYATKEKTTLEKAVSKLLKKYDLKVTTAESCTGGLLAGRLISVPGASDVLKEGFITYSNKAKRKYLDVDKNTLKKYTAVSEETAKEMAIGGAFAANRDVCVAVTGLAGPGGGTEEKPVGLVYIGVYIKDSVQVREYHLKGTREEIRQRAVLEALDLLRRSILENYQSCRSVENDG